MRYAAKKLLTLLVTMAIVSFLTFLAFSAIAGDPATAMLGTQATPEKVAALREEMGLNQPLPVRYAAWAAGFFDGDLGTSYSYQLPVTELLSQKIPVTLALALTAFVLIVAVSIPMGVRSVRWEGRTEPRFAVLDAVRTTVNQLLMAVPPFFTGVLFTWVFGILLRWFTPGKFPSPSEDPARFFGYLLLPALSVAIPRIAMTVRMLRSTILGEMNRDYVRTAISRGNDRRGVLRRHVLKNAMVPVVAFLAQTMAEVIAGSIVVEQVFTMPGLGRLLLASISNRDYPVVEAIVVILAFWVVLAGVLGDLISQSIDPRLRLGGEAQ
jgi:ABC-type dipeptide/oligopeptide/nickel transport systems, permease components